jgi:hypothetical protein
MASAPASPGPDGAVNLQPQKGRTWLPIAFGVLCGMTAFALLAMLETPAFHRLSVLVFKESSPKAMFAMPGYYCVHRTLLLALAAGGGATGAVYSVWPRITRFLFLSAVLLLVTVFAAIGFR